MSIYPVFPIGQTVWVLNEKFPQVHQGKIKKQEWWEANDKHPVYYDIEYPNRNRVDIKCPSTNVHFSNVFVSLQEAEIALQAMLNIGWYADNYFDWK